jgi:hypothetical protein
MASMLIFSMAEGLMEDYSALFYGIMARSRNSMITRTYFVALNQAKQ